MTHAAIEASPFLCRSKHDQRDHLTKAPPAGRDQQSRFVAVVTNERSIYVAYCWRFMNENIILNLTFATECVHRRIGRVCPTLWSELLLRMSNWNQLVTDCIRIDCIDRMINDHFLLASSFSFGAPQTVRVLVYVFISAMHGSYLGHPSGIQWVSFAATTDGPKQQQQPLVP